MGDVYQLKEMWGALVFRGMAAVLFGIAAVFWPGLTLVVLVYLFAAYLLASGLVNQFVGLANINRAGTFWSRLLLFLVGAAEVGVGIYLMRHPHLAFHTFILLVGLSLIVRGLFEVFVGLFGEGSNLYRTVLDLGGVLSVVAGVLLLFQQVASGVAFVWILGVYALITGPMLVALAFDAKNAVASRGRAAR